MQESLTNVVRHAGASQAEVTVTHHDDRVDVEAWIGAHPGNGASAAGHPGAWERRAPAAASKPAPPRGACVGQPVGGHEPASRCPRRSGVLLVDDQGLVRAGFRALLDDAGDVEVVGEAGDGAARSSWPARPGPTSSSWTSACR